MEVISGNFLHVAVIRSSRADCSFDDRVGGCGFFLPGLLPVAETAAEEELSEAEAVAVWSFLHAPATRIVISSPVLDVLIIRFLSSPVCSRISKKLILCSMA